MNSLGLYWWYTTRGRLELGGYPRADSKQNRKRPSNVLRIPIVSIETNGLSTICLQSDYSYVSSSAWKRGWSRRGSQMAVGAQPVDGDKCGNRQHVIKLIDRLVVLTHLGLDESWVRSPVGLLIRIP